MKMKPLLVVPAKPRALLIYDADREIDTTHPLWNEIMLYSDALEEVHCLILVKNLPKNGTRVVNLAPNVFAYYVPGNHLWWHFDEIVHLIHYHMFWQHEFRPHFVLDFSTHNGAWIGRALAARYHRDFFVSTSGTFLDLSIFSWQYWRQHMLVRSARMVFVPGEKVADALVNRIGVKSDRVSVVAPAVDLSFLGRKVESINYAHDYPQHNLILLTQAVLGHKRDLVFIIGIFKKLIVKYPRMALMVLVPTAQMKTFVRLLSIHHNPSIHLIPITDDVARYYSGAHIYLCASESDEATVPIIRSLELHVPVVTTDSTIAKEIFTGTPYERYMVHDAESFQKAVSLLVENQQERDGYRLNSDILVRSLKLQNLQGHISTILATIAKLNTP